MYSSVRRTDTTGATPHLDDCPQALVRRKLLGTDTYLSGPRPAPRSPRGSGRLDTTACPVTAGRAGARGVVRSPRFGYQRSSSTDR
ncbi:hypothetical protein LT493_18500 [Streptomyces tricolor]|nr:hypothetical protein [Streptomyces tricolor]